MKIYEGGRSLDGAVVTVDDQPLNPRFDLKKFSPAGFEWTYEGDGPRQLALAILADHLGEVPVLVLLAGLNVKALVYYLLGAVGMAFFAGVEQREKGRHALLALLGLGLLLLGLSLLKGSVADLRANPWVHEFLEFAGSAEVVSLLVGFIIATAVQSSSIVTVLALPLVHENLLGLPQVTLMIYGASIGSGFAVLLLAQGMEGASRQLALCQVGLRVVAATVLLPMFAVESLTGLPLVMAGVSALSVNVPTQCGFVYLAFQVTVSGAAALGGPWLCKLAAQLSPEDKADSQLKPAYLFDEGTRDPETALTLAKLEYRRLVGFLPEYVEELRDAGIDVWTTLNVQHLESFNDIVAQITKVRVRETLPDSVLEGADEVVLIDLPPEELIKRLKEGKVYVSAQAEQAMVCTAVTKSATGAAAMCGCGGVKSSQW